MKINQNLMKFNENQSTFNKQYKKILKTKNPLKIGSVQSDLDQTL